MSLPNSIPIPFPLGFKQSPNYTKGRNGILPDVIVIHIAEGSASSVDNTFLNTSSDPKSAHFLICQDGTIKQYVATGDTAFGNGIVDNPISSIVLSRPGINPNQYTISIEHEGLSTSDINNLQYNSTVKLVKFLSQKWNIPLDRTHIIGHREIRSSKTCPGMIKVESIIQQARL